MTNYRLFIFILTILLNKALHAEEQDNHKKPFTVEDLVSMERVSSPNISPNQKEIVFTVKTIDSKQNNSQTHLWMMRIDKKYPEKAVQLTQNQTSNSSPQWSPDGEFIFFSFQ